MEVIIKVPSSYFEINTSKYRLAISELTLIESLKRQTDKLFTIVLEVSAMDPCYSKRVKSFSAIRSQLVLSHEDVSRNSEPSIEITVDDDTFLHSELVQSLKKIAPSKVNRRLLAPNGYLFKDGILQVMSEKPDILEITQFVESDRHVRDEATFTRSHVWIHIRHNHNDAILFDRASGKEVTGLNWAGWQAGLVAKYCEARVAEATAQGCELYPTRSRSVVMAHKASRKRRKRG
jgi:hypothetical protein